MVIEKMKEKNGFLKAKTDVEISLRRVLSNKKLPIELYIQSVSLYIAKLTSLTYLVRQYEIRKKLGYAPFKYSDFKKVEQEIRKKFHISESIPLIYR